MLKVQIKENLASKTAERKGVCETRVRDVSEDPLNCGRGARHENGSELREEIDCVFVEQNLYFVLCIWRTEQMNRIC